MRSRLARAAAIACLAIFASACTKTLKIDQLQTQLASQLDGKLNTSGISVACPSKVDAKAGNTFDCTATLANGDTLTIKVTQADASGHVTWALTGAATPSPSASS